MNKNRITLVTVVLMMLAHSSYGQNTNVSVAATNLVPSLGQNPITTNYPTVTIGTNSSPSNYVGAVKAWVSPDAETNAIASQFSIIPATGSYGSTAIDTDTVCKVILAGSNFVQIAGPVRTAQYGYTNQVDEVSNDQEIRWVQTGLKLWQFQQAVASPGYLDASGVLQQAITNQVLEYISPFRTNGMWAGRTNSLDTYDPFANVGNKTIWTCIDTNWTITNNGLFKFTGDSKWDTIKEWSRNVALVICGIIGLGLNIAAYKVTWKQIHTAAMNYSTGQSAFGTNYKWISERAFLALKITTAASIAMSIFTLLETYFQDFDFWLLPNFVGAQNMSDQYVNVVPTVNWFFGPSGFLNAFSCGANLAAGVIGALLVYGVGYAKARWIEALCP